MNTTTRLEKAVEAIFSSYQKHAELERIGKKQLPTTNEIIELVKDIQLLIFPGFIRQEPLCDLDVSYIIGQKTASVYKRLQRYMEQVLCWEISQQGGDCRDIPSFGDRVESVSMEFIETIPELRDTLAEDVDAIFEGDPAARSRQEIILGYPGIHAICLYRIANFFYLRDIPLLPRIITEHGHSQYGIDIHPGASIGKGLMIDHGTGIVIGETTIIGSNVRIYQGVTLGALSPTRKVNQPTTKRHPTIENNVVIYAGATILGGKTVVGANSIVGGNVWLTHSIPPSSRIIWDANTQQQSIRREDIMLCPDSNKTC